MYPECDLTLPRTISVFYGIFAGLSFAAGCTLFFLFCKYRELRKGPGQLILAQCLAQVLLDFHWFTYFIHPKGETEMFCQVLGGVSFFAYVWAFMYAVVVCWVVSKHFYEAYIPQNYNNYYHAICFIVAALTSMIVGLSGPDVHPSYGTSIMGTCFIHCRAKAEYPLPRLATLIILIVLTTISVISAVRYYNLYSRNQMFSLNAVFVVLIFSLAWIGPAILHFLSWRHFDQSINYGFAYVREICSSRRSQGRYLDY